MSEVQELIDSAENLLVELGVAGSDGWATRSVHVDDIGRLRAAIVAVEATATMPDASDAAKGLRALKPFVAHWQPWMDERDENGAYYWPDDYEMSCFARVKYGDLRAARIALATTPARNTSQIGEG